MTEMNQITSRVRYALDLNEETKDAQINVAGEGGVITLSGTVDSHETAKAAELLASQQEGIVEVINDITVEKEGFLDKLNFPPAVPPQQRL